MYKFLAETRKPIGMVVFSYFFGEKLHISNISLWNKVNTIEDFRELEKEIEAKHKNSSSLSNFNIINIIYL